MLRGWDKLTNLASNIIEEAQEVLDDAAAEVDGYDSDDEADDEVGEIEPLHPNDNVASTGLFPLPSDDVLDASFDQPTDSCVGVTPGLSDTFGSEGAQAAKHPVAVQHPFTAHQHASTAHRHASTTHQHASTTHQHPSTAHQLPSTAHQLPSTTASLGEDGRGAVPEFQPSHHPSASSAPQQTRMSAPLQPFPVRDTTRDVPSKQPHDEAKSKFQTVAPGQPSYMPVTPPSSSSSAEHAKAASEMASSTLKTTLVSSTTATLSPSATTNSQLQFENENLRIELERASASRDHVSGQLAELKALFSTLQTEKQQLVDQVVALHEEIGRKATLNQKGASTVSGQLEEIARLTDYTSKLEDLLDMEREEYEKKEGMYKQELDLHVNAQQRVNKLEADLAATVADLEVAESDREQQRRDLAALNQALNRITKESARKAHGSRAKLVALEEQLEHATSAAFEQGAASVQVKLDESLENHQRDRDKLNSVQHQVAEQSHRIVQLESTVENLKASISETMDEDIAKQNDTNLIDRRVITKLLATFVQRGRESHRQTSQQREVLVLMSGILGFDKEDRINVGLERGHKRLATKASSGTGEGARSRTMDLLSKGVRVLWGNSEDGDEGDSVLVDADVEGKSFGDLWADFVALETATVPKKHTTSSRPAADVDVPARPTAGENGETGASHAPSSANRSNPVPSHSAPPSSSTPATPVQPARVEQQPQVGMQASQQEGVQSPVHLQPGVQSQVPLQQAVQSQVPFQQAAQSQMPFQQAVHPPVHLQPGVSPQPQPQSAVQPPPQSAVQPPPQSAVQPPPQPAVQPPPQPAVQPPPQPTAHPHQHQIQPQLQSKPPARIHGPSEHGERMGQPGHPVQVADEPAIEPAFTFPMPE